MSPYFKGPTIWSWYIVRTFMIGCFVVCGLCVLTMFIVANHVPYRYELPSKCAIVKVDGVYYARALSDKPLAEVWHEEITETQAQAWLAMERWIGRLGALGVACFLAGAGIITWLRLRNARLMPWE